MNNPMPAIVFGALLLLVGLVLLFSQRRARTEAQQATHPEERVFLKRRSLRRTQVAGMILIIGVMIPLGDSVIPWRNAPATFAIYWMIVIGLAFWTGLLAVGDMAATRAHMARELNRLHRHQLELHQVAKQVKASQQKGPADV